MIKKFTFQVTEQIIGEVSGIVEVEASSIEEAEAKIYECDFDRNNMIVDLNDFDIDKIYIEPVESELQ
jgi:hypothetical protein